MIINNDTYRSMVNNRYKVYDDNMSYRYSKELFTYRKFPKIIGNRLKIPFTIQIFSALFSHSDDQHKYYFIWNLLFNYDQNIKLNDNEILYWVVLFIKN